MYFFNKHLLESSKRALLVVTIFLSYFCSSFAQDYGWWNTLVQWDGKSHWSEYMTYTPKFFGPNALPIPDIKTGLLKDKREFEIGLASHFSDGDDAQNLTTKLYLPLARRVGIGIFAVPIERYRMTAETRDIRRARDFDGQGFAFGDVYISTWIQLTKPEAAMDLLLTINLKTASGSNREATRFTDGSGYSFDISTGKNYYLDQNNYIRPHFQVGFYVWETNEDRNPQNDAFSYGAGVEYKIYNTIIVSQIGGYIGYKGNGDKPMMLRGAVAKNISYNVDLKLAAQIGFQDFEYNSIFLSAIKTW